MANIWYLEDDHLDAEDVVPILAKYGTVTHFSTELEFRTAVQSLGKPDAVVLDQRVKWTDPSPHMHMPPEEVREEGYVNAGVRCFEELCRTFGDVPVIFYSAVDSVKIPDMLDARGVPRESYISLQKKSELMELFNALCALLRLN